MRSFIRVLTGLIAAAALSACASIPAYAPQASPGGEGYSEQRVDPSHWRVEFVGDETATASVVERNLLFRAAELTQSSGHAWFRPSDHAAWDETEIIVEAPRLAESQSRRFPAWGPQWRRRGMLGWSDWMPRGPMPLEARTPPEGHVWSLVRYSARETIEMGDGAKPVNAFDAAAIVDLLSPAVRGER